MSRGPGASKLCLLSSLPDQNVGEKVRFLGCVTAYNTGTACLTLGHVYPKDTNVLVSVNIDLVLETLQSGSTRLGEWLNVIGYVIDGQASDEGTVVGAYVQALMVWPPGPLDAQQYVRAVEDALSSKDE
ncbi:Telomere length regulation/capping, TEN1 [Metarhizium rileyi]|uniref:Telomere length regulation/capping, TEN1 n=1 Tax=Metarhizium rileyi (strain RCEF 4871) TaxID=1649241 RepID=A0A167D8Q1_METRR|nr:Telomere length regulation/capping, TEN1 [Metarhizium rileyi RCEF 4871]